QHNRRGGDGWRRGFDRRRGPDVRSGLRPGFNLRRRRISHGRSTAPAPKDHQGNQQEDDQGNSDRGSDDRNRRGGPVGPRRRGSLPDFDDPLEISGGGSVRYDDFDDEGAGRVTNELVRWRGTANRFVVHGPRDRNRIT